MKKIKFQITLANYSPHVIDRLKGQTTFDATGYVVTHPKHPGRVFAAARTVDVTERGAKPSLSRWWMYDVESGFRVSAPNQRAGTSARSREDAVEQGTQILDELSPEALAQSIEHRLSKLAKFVLEL